MRKEKADPGFKIGDLIDAKNKALFEEVNAKAPIQLVPSTNGEWGSVLNKDGKSSTVEVVSTEKPAPVFTHELLHIRLELAGLIKPKCCKFPTEFMYEVVQTMNDVAHHRMYPDFIALGYAPEEFLGTADQGVEKHIEQELDYFGKLLAAKKKPLGAQVLRLYFTIHNPHDEKTVQKYRDRFIGVFGQGLVDSLDAVVKDWKESGSNDYSPYVAKLFGLCGEKGWVFGKDEGHLFSS